MIVVANKRYYKGNGTSGLGLSPMDIAFAKGVHVEYIGRNSGGSPLQNNFLIGKDGTREEVIEKCLIYIKWRMESDPKFYNYMEALASLHKHGVILVLLCHCKPLPCHGDGVKEILESM